MWIFIIFFLNKGYLNIFIENTNLLNIIWGVKYEQYETSKNSRTKN